MQLRIKGWQFVGSPSEKISPELTDLLENIFPSTDSRCAPLMAQIRQGDGLKFGQVPELLDRFKVPHELI